MKAKKMEEGETEGFLCTGPQNTDEALLATLRLSFVSPRSAGIFPFTMALPNPRCTCKKTTHLEFLFSDWKQVVAQWFYSKMIGRFNPWNHPGDGLFHFSWQKHKSISRDCCCAGVPNAQEGRRNERPRSTAAR